MNNSDYWKRRIGMLEEARNADNTRLAERLQDELDYALKELDDKISGWYRRLADNNCVSMAQARKLLSAKELKEFYWTVDEYIEKGRENGIRHNWEKELENASARVHINKFEALKIELRGIAEQLGISEENQLKEHLSAQYEDTYYHTAFELQDGFGVYQNTAKVNQKHLNTVLSKPWTVDNKTFSDRIWEDKDALISEVTRQLTRNILLGRPRDDSIRAIAKRFETSKSNAARLVHTESAYISAEAARDTYDYLDVDRFEVDAALDSKTCSICGEMDGKVFETKDYQPGLTANPFHPNCRCTTVPYIDDDIQRELEEKTGRSMRNPETGKTEIVSRMTYKEWKAKYVDNSDKSDIIEGTKEKSEVPTLHYVGKIDKEIYSCVTDNKILSEDVIITDNRIQHIIERRGQDFYDKYKNVFSEIISNPDYVFKDKMPNTAIAAKTFESENSSINIVLRLIVEGENETYKNSIITAIQESDKRFRQRLRNNDVLYKKLDIKE